MLHQNVMENKGGFRTLDAAELDAVSGGKGSVGVSVEVNFNQLIEQLDAAIVTDAEAESKVNELINNAFNLGARTMVVGVDPNGVELKQIFGTDYYIKDSDNNELYDEIWQDVGSDPMFPDWRVFDGKKWRTSELRPWDNTSGSGMKSIFRAPDSALGS